MIYVSYINLSPGLDNHYSASTHHVIWETLNKHSPEWAGFYKGRRDYNLSFTISTKNGVKETIARGPDIYRRDKEYHYAIYIPEKISDVSEYLDAVFQGVKQVLSNFDVQASDVEKIKLECKAKLELVKET
jgi:hypothetical protein